MLMHGPMRYLAFGVGGYKLALCHIWSLVRNYNFKVVTSKFCANVTFIYS
jgi:hypothetical protein